LADDKITRGERDRNRVAANQPYELYYFKTKHGLTKGQALKIIERYGSDRDAANKAASGLKKK
jgi:hypothetical protein